MHNPNVSDNEDPLLPYLRKAMEDPSNTLPQPLSRVLYDVMTKGYSIIPSVLSRSECKESFELMWDFVEDVSGGIIRQNDCDPRNWYPRSQLVNFNIPVPGPSSDHSTTYHSTTSDDCVDTEDPWPHTGYASFPDMFQSLGAGFLLGHVRCLLAERLFEPLFGGLRELHCSKEGFTFARPSIVPQPPHQTAYESEQRWRWTRCNNREDVVSNSLIPRKSQGEHYDQSHNVKGLHTLQASVAFTDQVEEEQDGHFLCWPYSHSHVHQMLTGGGKYRGQFSWIPMNGEELSHLESLNVQQSLQEYLDRHGLHAESLSSQSFGPTHVYVKAGDVIVWRSDLLHAAVPPGPNSTRFRAVGYFSMQPACWTPNYPQVHPEKIQAYKHGMTGDHRAFVESWHVHKRWTTRKKNEGVEHKQRPYYRLGPPQISIRLAELYGLIPYDRTDLGTVIKRATIRGVRFLDHIIHEDPDCNSLYTTTHQIHSPRLKMVCDASIERLVMDDGSLLYGQEKYLGGMCSPCGNYVYGCPGHSHRVLRVNTRTNVMDFIGPSFPGKYKWLRGVEIPANVMANEDEYPIGCCLALPSNALSILKINPKNQEVTTFGNLTEDVGWLYHGGNLLADGFVYAIPANASRVLKIDPRENHIEYLGPVFHGKQKWYGGIVGCDGCLYGIPQNYRGVLKINPRDQSCSILTSDSIPEGDWKWHGGLAIQDGRFIMGFPNNADSVLIIDVGGQDVFTVHSPILCSGRHRIPQDGRYKYLGGAVTQDGRYTYLFPCDAERVLRMDNNTFELKLIGPLLLEGENKFQNGFLGKDGCLYGINQRSCGILRITPGASVMQEQRKNKGDSLNVPEEEIEKDQVDIIYCGDDMVHIKDKFEGGVMDLEGNIYCIPMQAKALIKIIPCPT